MGMNCISCQAALAPRSTHCYFCGAGQPQAASTGAWGAAASSAASASTTYTQWIASSAPNGESWRAWASFFLGGLYGPVASRFLYQREEWSAGVRQANAPPAAPSTRGLIVLGLFFGLPVLCILVLGFTISAVDVGWRPNEGIAYGLGEARTFAYLNVFVALFYVASWLAARHVDRQFLVLLVELTGGDRSAITAYREGRIRRAVAAVLAIAPLALVVGTNVRLLLVPWFDHAGLMAMYFLAAVMVAAWATSWLHTSSLARFRRAMLARP